MPATPEPAPTLQQLLAFYLEAGVDCALGDEPVDRLSEPEPAPAPAVREAPPAPIARPAAATPMLSGLAEPPAPDAAIASARELARFLKDYIRNYNKTCGAFTWTKGPKKLKRIIELTRQYQDRYARN